MIADIIKSGGYKFNEYLLVLNPHEDLCNKIIKVKQDFAERYKINPPFFSKSYIALVKFTQLQLAEERIVNNLKSIATAYNPFKVALKNFDSYPSHSIFINIESKQQVKNLIKEIKVLQSLMRLDNDNPPHFMDNPNITIAQKLKPWQYEKAWMEYSNKNFTAVFIADAMLLLKRQVTEKKYQIVNRLEFQNLQVTSKQGELF